jgi:nicotinate dehydrogenase subunit B
MSKHSIYACAIEPERYELRAVSPSFLRTDRREFLKLIGCGIVVLLLSSEAAEVEAQESGRRGGGEQMPQEISAWLHIGEDGKVTVFTGKVEVGQNIRTSLSQAVAEELCVPVSSIKLVMADTDLTPFDMGTFGSRSTPQMGSQLRKVGAAARLLLTELAAEHWKTDAGQIVVANGQVKNKRTGESIGFGALTKGEKLTKPVRSDTPLRPAGQWTIAGTSVPKVDAHDFVTGAHRYTSDQKQLGMVYGKVLRAPSMGAKMTSVDARGAEAIPSVSVVHEGDFVGVVAPNQHIAERALQAIRAEWQPTEQPSSKEIFDYLKNHVTEGQGFGGGSNYVEGSMEDGIKAADHKLQQTYTVAYIAHVPLEPRAALAVWKDDKLTVWTGTQRPFGVRSELAGAFKTPESKVRVITPDTGSGYGGKHSGECAVEAARLAKATGKPVKLVWTREEEFNWAYFRPAGVIDITSGAKKDGTLTAWEFHNYNSGASAIRTLYEVPNQSIKFHATHSPLKQGSYRGLAATANQFARETHMDELARAVGIEPLEFRLKNLKDPRLIDVFKAAANKFGWSKKREGIGYGVGIAGGFEKGGYVASCAEVLVEHASGNVKVTRLVTAIDCGPVINPEQLKNQLEGAAMMGLGGALFEAIQFENGQITTNRLSKYRVPRFRDMPAIEAIYIDRKDQPAMGAGEVPLMCIAPAIGNAIFDAVGVRLRSLPLAPNGVKV